MLERRQNIKENRDAINTQNRKHYWEDAPLRMLKGSRRRARDAGLEFSIEREDIIIPEFCPITGAKILLEKGLSKEETASLDRVDNSKGYIKGNVRVISGRANRIKSDATFSEIENLYNYVKDYMSTQPN